MKRRFQAITTASLLLLAACGDDSSRAPVYSAAQPVEDVPFGCATLAGKDGLHQGDGCQFDIGPGNTVTLISNGRGGYSLSIPGSPNVVRHFLNEQQAYSESLTSSYSGTVSNEDFEKFLLAAGTANLAQLEDGSVQYPVPQNLAVFYWEGEVDGEIKSRLSLIGFDSSTQVDGTPVLTN